MMAMLMAMLMGMLMAMLMGRSAIIDLSHRVQGGKYKI